MHFLGCIPNIKHRTILTTCYAAGLRISEAVHLKPIAIDRQRMVIRIEQGKGAEGPLCHALAQASGGAERLLVGGEAEGMAFPG